MVLVDSSVLVDVFRGRPTPCVSRFDDLLNRGIPFGITLQIYQEILQGAASEKDLFRLKEYLDTQTFYGLTGGRESVAEAAKIYFRCRRAGVTVRSTIDCLIARIAIENRLSLLHNDSDFDRIARVVKDLQIYQ